MYPIRYYAIGHSYLLHGPFVGWQTEGFWGMAASAPEADYFHRLTAAIGDAFGCAPEALAENHAALEVLCRDGATREIYEQSESYARIREVMEGFCPNFVTVFVGANTVSRDEAAHALFFDVLCGLLHACKRPEAVVAVVGMGKVTESARQMAEKYGFLYVDVNFLHAVSGRENPYYAYAEYPEYDARRAAGAVEFRTHPNDRGHAAIAEALFDLCREALAGIPDEAVVHRYDTFIRADRPTRFCIETKPSMSVSYYGFNVRQVGNEVVFLSAPGTGASLEAAGFCTVGRRLLATMWVDGAAAGDRLAVRIDTEQGSVEHSLPIVEKMHTYEIELPQNAAVVGFRIAPNSADCAVTVRSLEIGR